MSNPSKASNADALLAAALTQARHPADYASRLEALIRDLMSGAVQAQPASAPDVPLARGADARLTVEMDVQTFGRPADVVERVIAEALEGLEMEENNGPAMALIRSARVTHQPAPAQAQPASREDPFVVSAMEDAFFAGVTRANDPRPIHLNFAAWKRGEKS